MPLEKLTEKLSGKKDRVNITDSIGSEPETTSEMPVVPHKVLITDIPFYADPECQKEVEGARIAILRPLDPDGFDVREVVPCRKQYAPGQYLTWHLNNKKLWEDCYYQNPFTGKVEQAWTMHVEFLGRVVNDQTVEVNHEKIEKLEAQYPQDQDLRGQIM